MACRSFVDGDRAGRGWKPIELVAMILGFVVFWPIGLAILAFKMFGGHFPSSFGEGQGPMGGAFAWAGPWQSRWASWQGFQGFQGFQSARTGNEAFEEYRRSTLERLEAERRRLADEERAFAEFMRELRRARDREEFDRFMASRRAQANGQPGAGASGPQGFGSQGFGPQA